MIEVVFFVFLVILSVSFLVIYKKKMAYYKAIIDTSSNVVVVYDNGKMIEVNSSFFKYFNSFNSLKAFRKNYRGICDFFVKENECIYTNSDSKNWYDIVLENKQNSKVKIKISDKEYYFSVSASKISQNKNIISIILSDITQQENQKKHLLDANIEDIALDTINHKYYEKKVKDEIARATRYTTALSFVMFHIELNPDVNSQYKNSVKDKVYSEYINLIASTLRECDTFCRVKEDKFLLILPHVNRITVQNIAQKIELKVEFFKKSIPVNINYSTREYLVGDESKGILNILEEKLDKNRKD